MRGKLLQHGPGALADYELLEMLLFLGVSRRDTKPLAKATLNRFGSLGATLAASPDALAHLGHRTAAVLKLVEEASARLSRADAVDRPHLADWDRLAAYLDQAPSVAPWRTLYLNNRNRLLADDPLDGADRVRAVAARALALHATAVILVCRAKPGAGPGKEGAALARRLAAASPALAIQVHDCVSGGPGQWASLRAAGGFR